MDCKLALSIGKSLRENACSWFRRRRCITTFKHEVVFGSRAVKTWFAKSVFQCTENGKLLTKIIWMI